MILDLGLVREQLLTVVSNIDNCMTERSAL